MNKALRALMLVFGIVMIVSGAVRIFGALAEEAEGTPVPFETSIELNDGAGSPVATLKTRAIYGGVERQVTVAYTLTNHGDRALTQLNYDVSYFDDAGNDLRGNAIYVMIGLMTEPVQPGESRDFVKTHYFDGAEKAAAVALTPIDVKDEAELPPWTEPRPGNLLLDFCNYEPFSAIFEHLDENPPVEMVCRRDEQEEIVVTDVDEMLAQLEGFRNMRIGEESDERVTDSGIYYGFTMADGTTLDISFEAPGLFHWHGHVYEVIND